MIRHNATFARESRCLLFAEYSQSLRDCTGCRSIAWCPYYDRSAVREPEQLALARWEDDGGRVCDGGRAILPAAGFQPALAA
jgi:hypothetical protein